jgi:signal transduction histidine kinase
MKIRLRLILLLGCLLLIFVAATFVLQDAHQREAESIRATAMQQRGGTLDRLLVLTAQPLQNFANDYSLWDDMVNFVRTGDRAWAKANLDASLANFGAQSAWVLRPDGSPVYRAGELTPAIVAALPFADPAFLAKLAREKNLHFYLESPSGLLEVRTAPIQPSNDTLRKSPPRGWLLVIRLWNEKHLLALVEALQSNISFVPTTEDTGDPTAIRLQRPLPDWTGHRVRSLYVSYKSPALTRLVEGNRDETIVLWLLGIVMLAVTGLSVSRWVVRPLQQLGQSLESGRPEPLLTLRGQQNEFGHLARLVEQSFGQRAALEHEVHERSRMAEVLQETGTQLRESIELRSRLARDLHDGVIQSIYAAGLGLEGARSLLATDPAGADQRLAHCLAALNDTIRDVRTFINGLESGVSPARPFRQTLATLVATMQAIQPGNIALEVDEAVARRISPGQELQILQILRESISNALRHAQPGSIQLSLHTGADGRAALVIADDGRGFNLADPPGRGHGLVNLGIRAREMGGALQIDTAPGKGTRITLLFHPTYTP